MKSSVETRVAAAITASFVALTLGAIAQENSGSETRRRAQKSANVSELTKDGSLADLATPEIIKATDHVNRNEGEREDREEKHFKFKEMSLPEAAELDLIFNEGNDAGRMDYKH